MANGNGTVAVYSVGATTTTYVTTVTLASASVPTALALDATNGYVYVADGANNRVEYFNAATCNATTTTGCSSPPATVPVGNDPVALAVANGPGQGDLYVANAGGRGGISVVSLSTRTVVTTISTSQTCNGTGVVQSIGLSPDGNEVLAVLNGLTLPGRRDGDDRHDDQRDHCDGLSRDRDGQAGSARERRHAAATCGSPTRPAAATSSRT